MRNKYLDLIILFVFFAAIPCFAQNSGTANAPAETEKEGPENAESDYDDYDDYDDYADFGSDSGITVNAAPETTQQMRVLEKEDIEKHHAPDLASLLEEALDMSITRYGAYGSQTEMNLRGFDTERIAILVDGIPANSPRSGEFDVSQIDLNNVERIEVIYGGSDTKYNVSGALGGVINIITVKKQKPGLNFGGTVANTGYTPGKYNLRHARGEIGDPHPEDLIDMQTLSLFAGYGAEQFSWKASAFGNLAGNHYLYQDDYGFARRKTSGEVWDIGGDVALVWDLPMAATLLSDTKTYYANKNYPVTPNSTGYATAKDFSITENLMLNAPAAFRDDLGTEGSLTWQYSNTNYGVDIKNFDHYITAINRWGWFPSEKLTLRSGIDWRFLYIDSRSIGETNPVKTGNQGGLYVTAEWYPVKTLMLIASAKGATDTRQAVVIPKAGLLWKISPVFGLKNNYFRSFKFPDFDDLYYRSLDSVFVGNPDLKPEDGFGADLTGEFTPNEKFTINSTAFIQWTEDSIHWIKSAGGRWSPENIGTAFFVGADVRPGLTLKINKWGLESIKLGASYQFQFSWLLSGDLTFANSFRIPYMPTHILGGSVDLRWKTGSLLVSAHYETTRYADTLNQIVLDPHCVVNATVNQGLGKYLTAFASFKNILNSHYESFAGYYMPGISFTLGIRAKTEIKPKKIE